MKEEEEECEGQRRDTLAKVAWIPSEGHQEGFLGKVQRPYNSISALIAVMCVGMNPKKVTTTLIANCTICTTFIVDM